MKIERIAVWLAVAFLPAIYAHSDETLKVRNAAEAVNASVVYLNEHYTQKAPAADIQWRERTIFSGGPVDLVTTAKQFISDAWSIEVTEGFAPLKDIVYQVTVFSPKLGWYWKGSIKADGSVQEESSLQQLSEEEKQKTAEEFLRKSRIPPPQGGYGH
jgi:hypothetical protein